MLFVVIPAEVQKPVHDQLVESIFQIQTGRLGLPPGGIHRDHHIPQEMGAEVGEPSLLHRKGDDVGGTLPVQIRPVHCGDLGVVHQQDGQFGFRMP